MSEKSLHKIFVEKYRTEVSPERLFVERYNNLFHILELEAEFDLDNAIKLIMNKFSLTDQAILHYSETINEDMEKIEVIEGKEAKVEVVVKEEEEQRRRKAIIEIEDKVLAEIEDGSIKFLFADLSKRKIFKKFITQLPKKKQKPHKEKFYMIYSAPFEGLELKSFHVKKVDVSIEDYYNDDFIEVDTEIRDFLTDYQRDGIILLHGTVGTGKTTYLRYLMHSIDKRFIFLPPSLAYKITSPELLDFMTAISNSVLIMEDCEDLIRPRGSMNGSNEALVNLLNLGDGLLADALNLKIICTFNADVDKIDPALIRKGRLAIEYEFRPLEEDKARRLVEKLGLNIEVNKPMTLADIFVQKQIVRKKQKEHSLGFKNN